MYHPPVSPAARCLQEDTGEHERARQKGHERLKRSTARAYHEHRWPGFLLPAPVGSAQVGLPPRAAGDETSAPGLRSPWGAALPSLRPRGTRQGAPGFEGRREREREAEPRLPCRRNVMVPLGIEGRRERENRRRRRCNASSKSEEGSAAVLTATAMGCAGMHAASRIRIAQPGEGGAHLDAHGVPAAVDARPRAGASHDGPAGRGTGAAGGPDRVQGGLGRGDLQDAVREGAGGGEALQRWRPSPSSTASAARGSARSPSRRSPRTTSARPASRRSAGRRPGPRS